MISKNYHPYELSFCGYSGSGKTSLIQGLISKLSIEYKIGYLKHDAHKFVIDYSGKDTDKMSKAGASCVGITSSEKSAYIHHFESHDYLTKIQYLDSDFLFIEGFKYELNQKILVLGPEKTSHKIIDDYKQDKIKNIVAVVGPGLLSPEELNHLPYFQRDQIDKISLFIQTFFIGLTKSPTYGLILAGGKSTRMQSDKGALKYHRKFQTEHLKGLMIDFCEEVYVSCREDQRDLPHLKSLKQIHDKFIDAGPMGGILSAFKKHPHAKWLVVAVDLPYLKKETLEKLVTEHNPLKLATCFLNPEKGWPEPLCTLYNPKTKSRFLQFLSQDMSCPRKVLFKSEIKILELDGADLENANTPEDFKKANNHFNEGINIR